MADLNIYVLGAGIIGLTTALELKKDLRNTSVTILADRFYEDTTSYVAAGIFRPTSGDFGKSEEITRKWINDSYSYWNTLRLSREGENAGVKEISGYIFSSEYPHIVRNKYIEKLVPIYRPVTEDELKICPGDWKYGSYFSTILTDPTRYLKWIEKEVKNHDIKIKQKNISRFSEISSECEVIVNCTGLGAKTLCHDGSMVAIRGQVSKVDAPWIKHFYYGDYDTYIIPSFDNVTLGGCRQYESYDKKFNNYDYLSMRNRCETMLPNLKDAKLVGHRVGLRPHRLPVRVETEEKMIRNSCIRCFLNTTFPVCQHHSFIQEGNGEDRWSHFARFPINLHGNSLRGYYFRCFALGDASAVATSLKKRLEKIFFQYRVFQ